MMEDLTIYRSPGATSTTTVITLAGPLNTSTLFEFQDVLRRPETIDAIVDFRGVTYIDSAGLGTILAHWAHTQKAGRRFALAGLSERVRVIFEMTGVEAVIPTFPTVAEAEKNFQPEDAASAHGAAG